MLCLSSIQVISSTKEIEDGPNSNGKWISSHRFVRMNSDGFRFFLSVGPDLDPGARNEEAAVLRPILRFVEVPQGLGPAASPKLGGTVSRSEPIPWKKMSNKPAAFFDASDKNNVRLKTKPILMQKISITLVLSKSSSIGVFQIWRGINFLFRVAKIWSSLISFYFRVLHFSICSFVCF